MSADCVVVVTARASIDFDRIAAASKLVFDTRNVVPLHTDTVFTL